MFNEGRWEGMSNSDEEFWVKLVPKMRWSMSEGSMGDFEWWRWFDMFFGAIVSALRAFLSCSLAYLLTYCTLPLSKYKMMMMMTWVCAVLLSLSLFTDYRDNIQWRIQKFLKGEGAEDNLSALCPCPHLSQMHTTIYGPFTRKHAAFWKKMSQ